MGRTKTLVVSEDIKPKQAPAVSPEARETQLIALAMQRAEERLRNGTATSQEICHFLKLGSTKERLEKEMMEEQKKLLEAKTEAIQSAKNIESLYKDAIDAMRIYTGRGPESDEE